jgi:phage tail sheath gpL-like
MSGSISFPSASLSIIPAAQLVSVQEQKVLIVGQMLAAGSATAGALIQDHPNDGTEDALFGQTSHIAGLVRQFKKLNKLSRLDILPLADGGAAVKATAVAAVTGTATEDGEIVLTIGSDKNHKKTISITSGDSATDVGDAIVTAFDADSDLPTSQANVTGTVTFTAENGGTLADEWDIVLSGSVAGVTVALTGWTGGATDPTLTGILSVIANIRYQSILWPSVYALTEIETELNTRFNTANDVKDGVAFQIKRGTMATLKTYVATLNSQSLVIPGNKTVSKTLHKGSATVEMPDIQCAQVVAERALRLTDGAPLSQFMSTVAPLDQFGGIHIGSLPYANTGMPNLPIANAEDFFSSTDLSEMTDNGVSIIGPNRAYSGVVMGEMVTTYLKDTAGNPDTSYKYLNTVDTASLIREYYFENYKKRYTQSRLTDGDLVPGFDRQNEASIRAFSNRLFAELGDEMLTQKGLAAQKDYDNNLVIVVDMDAGTATVTQAPLLVSQLRAVIGTIQINFGT